jgi:hypothetical protein
MIHNYDREWSKKGSAPNNNNNYSFRRQLPPPPLPPQNFPHYPTSMQHPPSSSHFGAGIEKEISVVVEEFRRSRSDIQAPPNALTVPFLLHHLCIHFREYCFVFVYHSV